MSSAISIDSVVDSCIKGIEYSFKEYEKWSDGWWLWWAPEYLLTVNIAKQIWKIEGPKYLTLEDNVKKTLQNGNARIKGKLTDHMRPNGRSDIVLWWANLTPRAFIEVKHRVGNFEKISADIDRIIGILKKDSTIQFGISTFYMYTSYKKDIEMNTADAIKNLYSQTKEYIAKDAPSLKVSYRYGKIHIDENDAWTAVVLLVKK